MIKRIFCLLLTLVLALSLSPAVLADEEPVEIEYWFGLGGNLGNLFLSLIDEYNASQTKVHVTGVQYPDYNTNSQNYQASLASNTSPAAMHTQMGRIPVFQDYLEPLNERYENDVDFKADDILGGCMECMYGTDGETIYGVPLFATTQVMYYRLDAFAGYDIEETFATWQNLAKVAAEITKKDEAGNTVFYGWEPMWGSGNLVDAVQSAGGTVFTDKTMRKVNFLSDEWVEVMTAFSKWIHEDKIMRIHFGGTGWEYWYATIDDVMENRAAGYTGSAGDQGDLDFTIVGAHKQPGFGDHGPYANTDTHLGVISKNVSDAEKDAAWDFLKFLNSPKSQGKISMTGGYVVTRSTCLEDPDFAAFCAANPQVTATIDAVNTACKSYYDPTGGYVDTALTDLADNIEINNMDVREALEQCQEEAQSALDDYWAEQE